MYSNWIQNIDTRACMKKSETASDHKRWNTYLKEIEIRQFDLIDRHSAWCIWEWKICIIVRANQDHQISKHFWNTQGEVFALNTGLRAANSVNAGRVLAARVHEQDALSRVYVASTLVHCSAGLCIVPRSGVTPRWDLNFLPDRVLGTNRIRIYSPLQFLVTRNRN